MEDVKGTASSDSITFIQIGTNIDCNGTNKAYIP